MLSEVVATLVLTIFPAVLIAAAVSDFLTMTISNRLSLALALAFLVLAPVSGMPLVSTGYSLLGAAAVFLVCFALFAANIMGGGDAKLLTAASLWFGLDPSLATFIVSVAYAGGGVTLLFLLLRMRADTVMAMGIPLPVSIVGTRKIPYGIAIAIGGLMAFSASPIANLALKTL
ncbi:prepilin peptidase [Neorhizobium sp. NCHU2750]|uniref:A24 family peptidase n=1 Tax=Neorhizobium sp. NCHU2750 TaxID=1825976 RepID=UPI000E739647|nr:prepilin peptidase [Neorhizobium sp. NCHU2750]